MIEHAGPQASYRRGFETLGTPTRVRPVEADGAERAARMLAELL